MKFNKLLLATTLSSLVIASTAQAGPAGHDEMNHDGMNQGAMKQGAMNHDGMNHGAMAQGSTPNKMFLEKRDIDGYNVSFHVMPAAEGMNHGGSHNLMVKIEQGATVVTELQANSKVVYPDGKEVSKPLMKMGDWYMAGYDLKETGKTQLMVLFKTADGKKHFGGVHYGK